VHGVLFGLDSLAEGRPEERVVRCIMYFILGVMIGIFAVVLAAVDNAGRRTCPHCREQVSPKAKVCRYCPARTGHLTTPEPKLPARMESSQESALLATRT